MALRVVLYRLDCRNGPHPCRTFPWNKPGKEANNTRVG